MRRFFLGATVFLVPSLTFAHGVGDVYALPVPLTYYLFGSGCAVALSFFILAFFLNRRTSGKPPRVIPFPALRYLVGIARVAAVLLLALSIAAGFLGSQNTALNFTPLFFWVYFLIGTGVASIFVGNIWEKINPWKTLSNWLGAQNPKRSGRNFGWLSVVLLLGLFWLELLSGVSYLPRVIALALLLYTALNLVLGYRSARWYETGEVFSVMYSFIGTVAPFRISEDDRSFATKSTSWLEKHKAPLAMLGIAGIMLAATSFDSLLETTLWFRVLDALGVRAHYFLGSNIGFVLAPLPFLIAYLLAIAALRRLTKSAEGTFMLARRFVWSLAPIAFGYMLAHNLALLIVSAPPMLGIFSDPFGLGWNLFGTAPLVHTSLLLGAKLVWFIEIGLIVVAHVIGVWYAHRIALGLFEDPKRALVSQYPMMALMVGYTIFTLWLLSLPLVTTRAF